MKKKAPKPISKDQREVIKTLLNEKYSTHKIAEILSCNVQQVAAIKAHMTMGHY